MKYSTVKKILAPVLKNGCREINGSENIPEEGSFLIAANHVDFLDGFFISYAFHIKKNQDVFFLSKTKNYWWTSATLPIDPLDKTKSVQGAVDYLKSGKIICNFIEGKRNAEKSLALGKTGTARMALMARVPVLPVGIICPAPKKYVTSVANLLIGRHKVIINIGRPIVFNDFYSKELTAPLLEEVTHKIMRSLAPLCDKAYAY